MGSVGDFLLGGSKQSSDQSSESSGTSNSQQQSTNNSVNASASGSSNASNSSTAGYNQAYGPESAALTSSLGYVTNAGNMIGALLGLPTSSFNYNQTPATPTASTAQVKAPALNLSSLDSLVSSLSKYVPTAAPPSATSAPTTSGGTPVVNPTTGVGTAGPINNGYVSKLNTMDPNNINPTNVQYRAAGGPVAAGQPYVVGENQPELFVPSTSGTILPQAPTFPTPSAPPSQGTRQPLPLTGLGLGNLTGIGWGGGGRARGGPGGGGGLGFGGGGIMRGRPIPGSPAPVGTPTPTPTPAPATPTGYSASNPYNPTPTDAGDALNTFANSAGEQFILDQGQKAISGASAANGVFDSGATGKALEQYGTNLGSTYLDDYINNLSKYAQLGLGSATALNGSGGVNTGGSSSTGTSVSTSGGLSSGQSTGSSNSNSSSSGTGSSDGSSKKGLVPDVLG